MKKTLFLIVYILFINLLLLNSSFLYAQQTKPFDGEGPYIYTEKSSRYINFYVTNSEIYDMTVTIKFPVLVNMACTTYLPYTFTVMGGETVQPFSIYRVNPDLAWSYNSEYYWLVGSFKAEHNDDYIYSLPYASGTSYEVLQGYNSSFSHYGDDCYCIDWNLPEGTPVLAARDGVVVKIEEDYSGAGTDPYYKDYGNFVMVRHSDGTVGRYYHFQQYGVEVREGQKVKMGDYLGLSGNTGFSSGPHLHFDVFQPYDGMRWHTIPTKFKTSEHPEGQTLREGETYTAP